MYKVVKKIFAKIMIILQFCTKTNQNLKNIFNFFNCVVSFTYMQVLILILNFT